ncbi:hypothetical protein J6590_054474 [Homalodisca vitripennis]|nr:hypothetical protein J6590_054474 [Homalodisca vitripennis]
MDGILTSYTIEKCNIKDGILPSDTEHECQLDTLYDNSIHKNWNGHESYVLIPALNDCSVSNICRSASLKAFHPLFSKSIKCCRSPSQLKRQDKVGPVSQWQEFIKRKSTMNGSNPVCGRCTFYQYCQSCTLLSLPPVVFGQSVSQASRPLWMGRKRLKSLRVISVQVQVENYYCHTSYEEKTSHWTPVVMCAMRRVVGDKKNCGRGAPCRARDRFGGREKLRVRNIRRGRVYGRCRPYLHYLGGVQWRETWPGRKVREIGLDHSSRAGVCLLNDYPSPNKLLLRDNEVLARKFQ